MENPPFINHFPSYKPPFKTDLPIATFDYRMVFLSMLLFVPASSCCPRSNLSNHFFCAIKKTFVHGQLPQLLVSFLADFFLRVCSLHRPRFVYVYIYCCFYLRFCWSYRVKTIVSCILNQQSILETMVFYIGYFQWSVDISTKPIGYLLFFKMIYQLISCVPSHWPSGISPRSESSCSGKSSQFCRERPRKSFTTLGLGG